MMSAEVLQEEEEGPGHSHVSGRSQDPTEAFPALSKAPVMKPRGAAVICELCRRRRRWGAALPLDENIAELQHRDVHERRLLKSKAKPVTQVGRKGIPTEEWTLHPKEAGVSQSL